MIKKIVIIFILLIPIISAETIVEDKVYIDDDLVYLSAEPHTIKSSGWVVFELQSKKYTGDIDVVFGFNQTVCKPTKLQVWNNQWVNWNIPKTAYDYDFHNFTKWYIATDIPIEKNITYKCRVYIDIPFSGLNKSTGKYYFGIKPSSESLHEAISNGHFYYLDPWWDSSWNKCTAISFNSTRILSNQADFPTLVYIPPSISTLCDGGDSLRFYEQDNVTEIPFEIDYWNEATTSYVWVKVNLTTGTDKIINMYYNNSGASDGQDVANVWNGYMFTGVYHMNINNQSSTWVNDSSSLTNNGTRKSNGGLLPWPFPGQIGNCLQFQSAQKSYIEFTDSTKATEDMGNYSLTFIWWQNQNTSDNNDYIYSHTMVGDAGKLYIQRYRVGIKVKSGGTMFYTGLYGSVNLTGTWGQEAFIADFRDDKTRTYDNGILIVNVTTSYDQDWITSTTSAAYPPRIATDYDLGNANYFYDGRWDELWIINDTVNADFINTSFMNQWDVMNFSRILYNETYTAPATGYVVWSINRPTNGSWICPAGFSINLTVTTSTGIPFNITFFSNYTGDWSPINSLTSLSNGTYGIAINNFTALSSMYYWNATINTTVAENKTNIYYLYTYNDTSECFGTGGISYAWIVGIALIGMFAFIIIIKEVI